MAAAQPSQNTVLVLHVKAGIGPAIQSYIERGLEHATAVRASAVVLELDTPGGLDSSMRNIVKSILASPVPVISYVAPSGSRAASAGTFIVYASALAAMAPGTNLGAASPVSVSGDNIGSQNSDSVVKKSSLQKKVSNDAQAYIRSLAQLNKRNSKFAVLAITKAATLTAKEALAKNVINYIADDVPSLLQQANGAQAVVAGKLVTLQLGQAKLLHYQQDWRTKILAVITDPSIAYFLLLAGVYGLFLEFMHPGMVAPGVIGAICLFFGAYALQLLPINYAGLALIALGLAFMIAEAFIASFGILGLGGVLAFAAGSLLLFDTDNPAFQVSRAAIAGFSIFSLVMFIVVARFALRSRQQPVVSGSDTLIGQLAELEAGPAGKFYVFLQSEHWQVSS
ncbi:MAG: nodulation protein NfeD, partial [Candidatus Thioglobus sp.]